MFSASSIDSFGKLVRIFTESLPKDSPIYSKLLGLLQAPEAPVSRNSLLTRAVVQLAKEDLTPEERKVYENFIAQFPEICQLNRLDKELGEIERRIQLLNNLRRIEKPPFEQVLTIYRDLEGCKRGIERRIEWLVRINPLGIPPIELVLSILEDLEKVLGDAPIDLSPILDWILTGSFPPLDPSQTRLFALYAEMRGLAIIKDLPLTESTIRVKALSCNYRDSLLKHQLFSYARSLSEGEMLELLKSDWAKDPSLYVPLCEIFARNFSTPTRERVMKIVQNASLNWRNEKCDKPSKESLPCFDADAFQLRYALETGSLPKEFMLNFKKGMLDSNGVEDQETLRKVDRLFDEVKAGRVLSLTIGYLHDSWFDTLVTRCLNSPLETLDLPIHHQQELDLFTSRVEKARLKKLRLRDAQPSYTAPLNLAPLLQALHRHPTIRELDIRMYNNITKIEDEILQLWSANPRIRVEAYTPKLFDKIVAGNNLEMLRRYFSELADIPPPPTETDALEEGAETSEELDSETMDLLTNRFPQIEKASRPGSLRRLNALTPFEDLAPSEIIDLTLLELQSIADAISLNPPDFSPFFIYVLTGEVPLRLTPNQVKVFRAFWERRPSIPLPFVRYLPVKEPFLNEIAAAAVSLRDTDLHRQALTLLPKLSAKQLKRCFDQPWAYDSWFYHPLLRLLSRENDKLKLYLSDDPEDKIYHQSLYRGPFDWVQSHHELPNPKDYPLVSSVTLFEANDEAHSILKGCENLVRLTVDGVSGEPLILLLSSLKAERVRELRLLSETEGIPLTSLEKCAPFLNSLFLECVYIGKEMVDFIAACEHLYTLTLSNCSSKEPEALSLAIRNHPSLKRVSLSACMIKECKMVTDLIEESALESLVLENSDLPPLFSQSVERAKVKFLEFPAVPLGKLSPSIERLSITSIRTAETLQSALAAAEGSLTLTSLELHIQFHVNPAFLLAFIERNPQIAVRSRHLAERLIRAIATAWREDLLPLILNPLLTTDYE